MSAVRFDEVVPPHPREGWPGPVSFELAQGSLTVLGTSPGAAVSVVRLIAGLCAPNRGRVEVLGREPARLGRWEAQRFRRRLGLGFGEPTGLVSNLSLRMNLVVPMVYSGMMDYRAADRRARETLAAMGLGDWADTRPADLPAEIRREAVIARAVVREPELLVLEEPLVGVRTRRARWLLAYCRERAGTVVIATAKTDGPQHELADQLITMDEAVTEAAENEVGAV